MMDSPRKLKLTQAKKSASNARSNITAYDQPTAPRYDYNY